MKNLKEFNSKIEFVLTDIDDTLTTEGQLHSEAFNSLWKLHSAGLNVIPITGRPAGWCEMIARQWPVAGVIGENGGFYFHYSNKKMHRWFSPTSANPVNQDTASMSPLNPDTASMSPLNPGTASMSPLNPGTASMSPLDQGASLSKNRKKLDDLQNQILQSVPGAAVASDQFCRLMDLAIDFCEDVPRLPQSEVQKIVQLFEKAGAQAKVSSIHVNGWFGTYNKLTTTFQFLKDRFNLTENEALKKCIFAGDSPNDEPMFEKFPHSFGVANIQDFKASMNHLPKYVTSKKGGEGFTEIATRILECL